MNCHDFDVIVISLARNRLLDATIREQGLSHAEACARCGERLSGERALVAGVRAVVSAIAGLEAPARVEATLLASFREQPAVSSFPRIERRPRWRWPAIAAAVLILISIAFIFRQRSVSLNPKQETQAVSEATPSIPAIGAQPSTFESSVTASSHQKAPQETRTGHRRANPSPSEPETVTEFFALVDEERLDSLESLQVVRVELPASALLAVGLPVDVTIASESVTADVVLGQDGLAHAIRFVR